MYKYSIACIHGYIDIDIIINIYLGIKSILMSSYIRYRWCNTHILLHVYNS